MKIKAIKKITQSKIEVSLLWAVIIGVILISLTNKMGGG